MTATSALEKVEELVVIFAQRLIPQALQRLSVAEILSESSRSPFVVPTKEALGVAPELEPAYHRLVKFLRLHEPTGHEKDVAHKRDVMRYIAITRMLHECQCAKLPHIQADCLQRVLQWFEETASIVGSVSTPILPPRMSPKKTQSTADTMVRSSSQDILPSGSVDVMLKAAVQQKLEKYKMPNLRASHIRRVAQLRSRGVEISDEQANDAGPETHDDLKDDDSIPEPGDYEKNERRAKIKATFTAYEPETDAEFVMNQMWLEHQRDQEIDRMKEQEVRSKLHSWSMNRSRDESEYLRKHEAMQLAAGLDKFVDEQFEVLNHPRRGHIERKKQEWVALQQSVSTAARPGGDHPVVESPAKGVATELDTDAGTAATPSRSRTDTIRKKAGATAGPGASLGSGGMHFRNQLPANYTPQGKRSGTPQSFSSKGSKSTPSTPLSSSSSGKLELLDEAAARAEGRVREPTSSKSLLGSDGSPAVHEEDGRIEAQFPATLKFSERTVEPQHEFKFQPFLPLTQAQQRGTQPLTRVVSAPAINRKLFPRGTLPPQAEPLDPEYRHLHMAATSRKPPLPTTLPPDKPVGKMTKAQLTNNQHEAVTSNLRTAVGSLPAGTKRTVLAPGEALLNTASSGHLLSDLRAEQLQEVERIRTLFERHHLNVPSEVLERGLVLPEDRSALECAQNLPLPGCRLVSNPLLVVKTKNAKASKKKKKKKKKGAKGEKTKGKKTPGDKSPKKSKKK